MSRGKENDGCGTVRMNHHVRIMSQTGPSASYVFRKVKDPCLSEIWQIKVHELIKRVDQSISMVAGTCSMRQSSQKREVSIIL
ncbi:hypothetical protein DY000_02052609 [Brassica cretica]|uniref:Uncharacterized protein n=1 Tax=Brassica cretica TaxID=69181 RepID=A0ABQ7AEJ7_BRACR|nr:hypothetical protein DY000_02052609 [Brassica cretica]